MSLLEVQQRTSEIASRLRSLAPQPAPSVALGGSFAASLSRASAATASPVLGRAAGGLSVSGSTRGADVVAMAKTQLGTPYVWGAESPGGFDCSGLVQWTYKQFGIDLPRVSRDQAKVGRAVSAAEAQPGDLVFFDRPTVDHIGIYAGNGTWVVAPKTGDVVKVQSVDLSTATTIRRVLPTATAGLSAAAPAVGGWAAGLPAKGKQYADQIATAAAQHGVPPQLLAAVAWSESGFDPNARSSAGAIGLMQIMPATAAGLGVDPTDPGQALQGGAKYLSQQLQAFGRNDLALAAYNAGPGAVRKHGGIPPYAETQKYVTTVLDRYRQLGGTA